MDPTVQSGDIIQVSKTGSGKWKTYTHILREECEGIVSLIKTLRDKDPRVEYRVIQYQKDGSLQVIL